MKPKYCADFGHPNINGKQFVGLTESQLIKTLLEQGVHRVLTITHDEYGGHALIELMFRLIAANSDVREGNRW
jgi:hypothetical protein